MDWKEFFLDIRKIVLFLILFFITSFFVTHISPETSTYRGYPFVYNIDGCVSEIICYDNLIYWDKLILDIIIWFIISCLIVSFYDKRKKK
jgi:hypothetical protein